MMKKSYSLQILTGIGLIWISCAFILGLILGKIDKFDKIFLISGLAFHLVTFLLISLRNLYFEGKE